MRQDDGTGPAAGCDGDGRRRHRRTTETRYKDTIELPGQVFQERLHNEGLLREQQAAKRW